MRFLSFAGKSLFFSGYSLLVLFLSIGYLSASSLSQSLAGAKSGDIIFRAGIGYLSDIVRATESHHKNTAYSAYNFTHVGMLIQEDNEWKVIHAEPAENDPSQDIVKKDPLAVFLDPKITRAASIYRVPTDAKSVQQAIQFVQAAIGTPFSFASVDQLPPEPLIIGKSAHYYCTELILAAFNHQRAVLQAKPTKVNLPLLGGYYFLPNDLLRTEQLDLIAVLPIPSPQK